jgi:peptide/nickel transport system permease protein
MVLILYLGVKLDWFPIQGMYSDNYEELSFFGKFADQAHHYVLITVCFTVGSLAYYSRFVRQNLLEVVQQDFIRTARAKGLSEFRVIIHHAFRNTLIPFVSLLGLTLPFILSGSVILEHMFNWPGIGWLYMESVMSRDVNAIMGLNFMTAALVLVCTLLADLAYGLVDPRISHD